MYTYFTDSKQLFTVLIEDAGTFNIRGVRNLHTDFNKECPNVFVRNMDGTEYYLSFQINPHPKVVSKNIGIVESFLVSLGEFCFWLTTIGIYVTKDVLEKELLKVFTPLLKKRVSKSALTVSQDGINKAVKFSYNFPNGVFFEASTHYPEKDRFFLVMIGNTRLYGRFSTTHKAFDAMRFFDINWLVNCLLAEVSSSFTMLQGFAVYPYVK